MPPIIRVRLIVVESLTFKVQPNEYFHVTIEVRLNAGARDAITFYTGNTVFNEAVVKRGGGLTAFCWWRPKPTQIRPPVLHQYPALSPEIENHLVTLCPGGLPYTKTYRVRSSSSIQRGVRYRLHVSEDRPITWWRYGQKEKVLVDDALTRPSNERGEMTWSPLPMMDLPKDEQIVLTNEETQFSLLMCPMADGSRVSLETLSLGP